MVWFNFNYFLAFQSIASENFTHVYDSALDLFKDFNSWLRESMMQTESPAKQTVSHVKTVWQQLDSKFEVTKNKLSDENNFEDRYLSALLTKLKADFKRPAYEQSHV